MALAVCDILDEVLRHMLLSRIVVGEFFTEGRDDRLYDLDILALVVSADIIGLEELSLLLDHVDALAVILYVEPVTDVLAIAVDRKILAVQRIVDHQRDELLRELIRAVVIAAVRDIGRELIGVHEGLDHKIGRSLACGIRAVRIVRRCLVEIIIRVGQGAVNFICRYVKELLPLLIASVRIFPRELRRIEHGKSSQYIGLYKNTRILDRAVDMALRRKVNDTVHIIFLEDPVDRFCVTDVCPHKCIIIAVLHILQILQISCVRKLIDIDDPDLIAVLFEHIMNIIRSDESGTASYDIRSHKNFSLKTVNYQLFF